MNHILTRIKTIEFPERDQMDWNHWPPKLTNNASDVKLIYAGDMTQVCAIISIDENDFLVCDHNNCLIMLQLVFRLLFPGELLWDELRGSLGVHDYFWYSYSIECDEYLISDLPRWCQQIWDIIREASMLNVIEDNGKKYYYIEHINMIPHHTVLDIYDKIWPIIVTQIRNNQDGVDVDDAVKGAERIFSTLAKMEEQEYHRLVENEIIGFER